jgi:NitT/TauT family transport system substrate-binding protein
VLGKKTFVGYLVAVLLTASLVIAGCSGKNQSSTSGSAAETPKSQKEVVKIGIGYQAPTAQTWGALIIKNKKLYEKYLQEKYPDKVFEIEWFNSPSGPPLTNNMIAGKLQLALMGDMPILINGEQGQTSRNYKSVFLAFDGKGAGGKNQAILTPKGSNIKMEDLKGKTISTILGSSAHRMLLVALDKYGLTNDVTIVNQDVTVGMSNIEQNKIIAHATWEPYPSLIQTKDIGDVLLDGSETNVDYLDGVVADRTWVENNREYAVAFLKALIESHKFIRENPEEAARIFQEESQYPLDVTKKIVQNVRFDAAIYSKDITTLEGSRDFLQKLEKLKSIDLNKFVDDQYLKAAFKELGYKYPTETELKGDWIPLK